MMIGFAIDTKMPNEPPLFSDPWEDWKPQWGKKKSKKDATPHDFQESHSPTEGVSLKIAADRQISNSQRRIVDARLWDAMEPLQQQAAIEIALAFETMGRGLGYITSDWQRVPGANGPSTVGEAHSRLINSYIDWTKRCHKENVSHSMVIDILAFGFSCRALEPDGRPVALLPIEGLVFAPEKH